MESNRNFASKICFELLLLIFQYFYWKKNSIIPIALKITENIFFVERRRISYTHTKNCSISATSKRSHKKRKMKNFSWKFHREFRHCEFKFQCQIPERASKIHPSICCRDEKNKMKQNPFIEKIFGNRTEHLEFLLPTFRTKLISIHI